MEYTIKKQIFILLQIVLVTQFYVGIGSNSNTWFLNTISFTDSLSLPSTRNVTIGLIDSGMTYNNTYLWNNPLEKANGLDDDNNGYIDDLHGWNFVTNSNNITDTNGHGTVMATLITTLDQKVSLLPLVVLNAQNTLVSDNALTDALQYAITKQVNIIVLAIYFSNLTVTISDLLHQALAYNIAILTSSGNYGNCLCNENKTNAIGDVSGVLTIGAVDQTLHRPTFSQYGPNVDLVAPGVNLTISNKLYSGTSMATAIATGAYALLNGANFNSSYDTELLERTATDLNTTGYDMYTGHGLINVSLSIEALQDTQKPMAQWKDGEIHVTDNIGIYSITNSTSTLTYYGQHRSVLLKSNSVPQILRVEDLAGNINTIQLTTTSKPLGSINFLSYFMIGVFFLYGIRKTKKEYR